MNEKTTLYLETDVKEESKVQLIRNGDNQSLSNLVNELLKNWLRQQKASK